MLFKHTYYRRVKTELVMTVTPQIVRPHPDRVRVALPTDRGPMSPEEIRTRPAESTRRLAAALRIPMNACKPE